MASDPRRVALCIARFYSELADKLEVGARAALSEARISEIEVFDVAGAFELPLAAKYAAKSGRFAAVVCLGAVVRGETDHYTYVCAEAARGIQPRVLIILFGLRPHLTARANALAHSRRCSSRSISSSSGRPW